MTMSKEKDIQLVLDVLARILSKKPGEDIDPRVIGENLRMSIVFVGRHGLVYRYGVDPYLKYIKRAVDEDNIDRFFLLATGDSNIAVAREVADNLKRVGDFEELASYQGEIENGKHLVNTSYIYLKLNGNHEKQEEKRAPTATLAV